MNSLFENRNIDLNANERLSNSRCPECGYVGSHTQYPRCSWRNGYEATGNPFLWRD